MPKCLRGGVAFEQDFFSFVDVASVAQVLGELVCKRRRSGRMASRCLPLDLSRGLDLP